jgi:hypothetical protein
MKGEIMKRNNLFWGIFFIIAAIAVIAGKLGYFTGFNIYSIALTILLVPVIIQSIENSNFGGILFPLAIIGIIYAKPLGIESITPWPLLLTALLASIGLSMIFGNSRCHRGRCGGKILDDENFDTIVNSEDNSIVDYSVKFGSSIKYVNSKDLQKANLGCSFGALKVYFDNTSLNENGAEICLDISFAGVELYIPKTWKTVNEVNVNLADVEEVNSKVESNGPIVRITGKINLGGVQIIYV